MSFTIASPSRVSSRSPVYCTNGWTQSGTSTIRQATATPERHAEEATESVTFGTATEYGLSATSVRHAVTAIPHAIRRDPAEADRRWCTGFGAASLRIPLSL